MLRNELYLKRNPPPVLKGKEIRRRRLKAQLMRRSDEDFCEWCVYVDPRDDRYQMKTPVVKAIIEDPEYQPLERKRKDIGIPMPPIYMMEKALKEIAGERRTKVESSMKTVDGGGEAASGGRRKKAVKVDLAELDSDFASYKGLKLPKKKVYQKRR